MNISELQAKQGKVELEAEVIALEEPREFVKFGKPGKVCNAKIKDDSGEVVLTLWNEQIDNVKIGDKVKVSNGWVSEWNGELQLSTGKFGKLEVLGADGNGDKDGKFVTNDPKLLTPEEPSQEFADDDLE